MSIAFIIMCIGALITAVSWVNATQNRIDNVTSSLQGQRTEIDQLKTDSSALQIALAEIRTQLRSIDSSVLEIKENQKVR